MFIALNCVDNYKSSRTILHILSGHWRRVNTCNATATQYKCQAQCKLTQTSCFHAHMFACQHALSYRDKSYALSCVHMCCLAWCDNQATWREVILRVFDLALCAWVRVCVVWFCEHECKHVRSLCRSANDFVGWQNVEEVQSAWTLRVAMPTTSVLLSCVPMFAALSLSRPIVCSVFVCLSIAPCFAMNKFNAMSHEWPPLFAFWLSWNVVVCFPVFKPHLVVTLASLPFLVPASKACAVMRLRCLTRFCLRILRSCWAYGL